MSTTPYKANFYHSRTKSSAQKGSRIAEDFDWQLSGEERIIGTPQIELNQNRSSAPDKTKEEKRVESYKNIFGESTDLKNASYINDLLASKTRQKDQAKLQEDEKSKKERMKKNRRSSSQNPSAEPSKSLSIPMTDTKTPEKPFNTEPQKDSKSQVEEESAEKSGSPLYAKMSKQYENTDSVVVSRIGTINSIETGKPELHQMDSIMTGSFVRVEDSNRLLHPNLQASNFSSFVRMTKLEESEQPSSAERKSRETQVEAKKAGNRVCEVGSDPVSSPEFVEAITEYIGYFEKPSLKGVTHEGDVLVQAAKDEDPSILHHEIQNLVLENKNLHSHLEAYHKKVHSLQIMNQILTDEIIESRSFTNQLQEKMKELEKRDIILTESYNTLQIKLDYTQELLAKEKVDNENNLIALKRALSFPKISPYEQYRECRQKRIATEAMESNPQSLNSYSNLDKLFRVEQHQQRPSHPKMSNGLGMVPNDSEIEMLFLSASLGSAEERNYKHILSKHNDKLAKLLKEEDDDITLQSSGYSDLEASRTGSELISTGATPKYIHRVPSASSVKQNLSHKLTSAAKIAEDLDNLKKHKRVASTSSGTSSKRYSNFSSDLLSKGNTSYMKHSGSHKLLGQIAQYDRSLSKFENPSVLMRKRMDLFEDSSTTYDFNNDSF